MKDFTEHCRMSRVCVLTRNFFKHDGCIEEERAKQRSQVNEEAVAEQE